VTEKEAKAKWSGEDRREQLVRIAMNLIATKGFEGLRFQEVAKEAGINNATLFYHFSSKEELIQAVMKRLGEEFRRVPAQTGGGPANALEELRIELASVGDLARKRLRLLLVYTELSLRALRDPVIGESVRRLEEGWHWYLSDMIARGQREGVFRAEIDAQAAALALIAQCKGIGFHALTAQLSDGEIERMVGLIMEQVEAAVVRETGARD
jgi:AcrR family transcriptional regulator